jgi:arylsulfatase A-like enzyme
VKPNKRKEDDTCKSKKFSLKNSTFGELSLSNFQRQISVPHQINQLIFVELREQIVTIVVSMNYANFEEGKMRYHISVMAIVPVLVFFVAIGAGAVLPTDSTDSDTSTKPNIIFILADDLGYGEVGCFGQERISTPHIDMLAGEGMRLTSHYAGSPVCAPSRCTLLTGLHTGHAVVRSNREVGGWGPDEPEGQFPLPAGIQTLGGSLQKLGYATGAFGKWGLGGPDSTGHPNEQGFDYFYGYLCQRVAHNYYPTHLWRNNEKVFLEGNETWFSAHQRIDYPTSFEEFSSGTYAPDKILEEAIQFINAHSSKPFFLYFASTIPHLALQIPDDELDQYPKSWDTEPYLGENGYLPHPRPRAAYAAMISRFDMEVGNIYRSLKRNGIADNTLIVVTSDNGPSWVGGVDMKFFNSSGVLRGRKAQLFEGGIRVPTVVWWPGHIPARVSDDTPTAFWDWYPTLMAVAGAEPIQVDGIDILPLLKQEETIPPRGLYWEHGKSQAFRKGQWKLYRTQTKDGIESMLYHLGNDIAESNNLAKKNPTQLAVMIQEANAARISSKEFSSFLDSLAVEE